MLMSMNIAMLIYIIRSVDNIGYNWRGVLILIYETC